MSHVGRGNAALRGKFFAVFQGLELLAMAAVAQPAAPDAFYRASDLAEAVQLEARLAALQSDLAAGIENLAEGNASLSRQRLTLTTAAIHQHFAPATLQQSTVNQLGTRAGPDDLSAARDWVQSSPGRAALASAAEIPWSTESRAAWASLRQRLLTEARRLAGGLDPRADDPAEAGTEAEAAERVRELDGATVELGADASESARRGLAALEQVLVDVLREATAQAVKDMPRRVYEHRSSAPARY